MKRILFIVLSILCLLPSCNDKKQVREPEPLLTEQQMVDVMTDAYLIEAILNQKKTAGEEVSSLQQTYYDQLFEHYGITDSIFEANMNYYSQNLAVLERIMDSVTNRCIKAQ